MCPVQFGPKYKCSLEKNLWNLLFQEFGRKVAIWYFRLSMHCEKSAETASKNLWYEYSLSQSWVLRRIAAGIYKGCTTVAMREIPCYKKIRLYFNSYHDANRYTVTEFSFGYSTI